ncbi:MAG TPA: hypothetical protein ENK17_01745 [Anaerolineae bacterium]|nr:hypothetical protein [Anaerolineae bacterium]
MRPRSFLLLLLVLAILAGCRPQPVTVTREPVALRVVAADSCGPLADALAASYAETRPWVTVTTAVCDTTVAEEALEEGEADVALLSWIDQSARRPDSPPLWVQPFALDGVVVVVHRDSSLTEVGLAQLQEIFRGRMQEWDGMVLAVVSREEGSGVRAAFESVVLGYHPVTPNSVVASSNGALAEYVAHTPATIGYLSALWLDRAAVDGVRVLPVEGVWPTAAAFADGTYPIVHPLYLATVAEPTGESRAFAQWVLGPEGQAVLGVTGGEGP